MPCAYCGSDETLTREHVWPKCILTRTPSYSVRYVGRAHKITNADLTIRDVCRPCNNGPLSDLDAYFCNLYDDYFSREIAEGMGVIFKYDFGKLVRALLKIAYNSARTTDIDTVLLKEYAPVIVSPDVSPLGVFVKVATIHCSQLFDTRGRQKIIRAQGTRSGPIVITNRNRKGVAARVVQIDSYRFLLIVTENIFNGQVAVRYLANERGAWLTGEGELLICEPTLSARVAFEGVQHWRSG